MSKNIPIEQRLKTLRELRDKELQDLENRVVYENLSFDEVTNMRQFIKDYFLEWEMNLIDHYNQWEVK